FYDAVKIYFKFVYENGRDPTPSECITLHLAPERSSEYAAELQRLLQEGESSSLFEEEGDDEIKGQHYEDFVAREATNIAEKWHDQINRINIPTLVAEEGCSFADAIAIAHWLVDHGIASDSALAIDVNPPPLQINHLEEAKFCPSCGHPLPAFQPGDKSVICEDCGYELKKGDRE
ncbi:MAG TPA: hypothetical protein VKK79_13125, partial [Candidatus Lokiarchaeia archaeon]|nr:hypothetical protein [Candidatus Lokiarchaeia archaeon]